MDTVQSYQSHVLTTEPHPPCGMTWILYQAIYNPFAVLTQSAVYIFCPHLVITTQTDTYFNGECGITLTFYLLFRLFIFAVLLYTFLLNTYEEGIKLVQFIQTTGSWKLSSWCTRQNTRNYQAWIHSHVFVYLGKPRKTISFVDFSWHHSWGHWSYSVIETWVRVWMITELSIFHI